jgi:protease-4
MSEEKTGEPLPTVEVGPPVQPQGSGAPAMAEGQPPPPRTSPQAAPPPQPAWGAAPPWGPPPGWTPWGAAQVPPPPPPPRDRLAIAVVAAIFGGLFLVFFGFLFLAWSAVKGDAPRLASGPRIGVVEVEGPIGADRGADADDVMKTIRRFAQDDDMKAVVVRIDSPGGSVAPSQEIYDELGKLAEKKTVVCSMGDIAASGGFYIAMACPTIVAEPGTLTGSIGVISQFPNIRGLAERFDVKVETVKSGPLKDAGNPFREMTEDDRKYWQSLIDRVYAQFLSAVVESRQLPEEEVRKIADGRVITGEEAKELGLIDELGNFHFAVDLAKEQARLQGEPNLVYPPDDRARFLEELMGGAARSVASAVRAELQREGIRSDRPGLYYLAN